MKLEDFKSEITTANESLTWNTSVSPMKSKVQSLYYSTKCKYIYFIFLILTICIAIWSLVDLFKCIFPPTIFYVFESIINFILLLDIILRIWINGLIKFLDHISNVFGLALVVLCVIISVITIARMFVWYKIDRDKTGEDIDEVLDTVLMTVLCLLQYLRIAFLGNKQSTQVLITLKIGIKRKEEYDWGK